LNLKGGQRNRSLAQADHYIVLAEAGVSFKALDERAKKRYANERLKRRINILARLLVQPLNFRLKGQASRSAILASLRNRIISSLATRPAWL
jgi:hypothetical protein